MQLTYLKTVRAARALVIASAALAAVGAQAQVQTTYVTGTITDTTSTPLGYLIRLDTGRPTNCNGAPFGWMLIKSENKVVIATVMMMFALGKKTATVYTTGIGPSGHCEVDQYDPVE
jgi:hypothetical protein